jgi:hypothetical protein
VAAFHPSVKSLCHSPTREVTQSAAKFVHHRRPVCGGHVGFIKTRQANPCPVENVGLITGRMDRLGQGLG